MGTVIYRALLSLYEGSLKITLTVLLALTNLYWLLLLKGWFTRLKIHINVPQFFDFGTQHWKIRFSLFTFLIWWIIFETNPSKTIFKAKAQIIISKSFRSALRTHPLLVILTYKHFTWRRSFGLLSRFVLYCLYVF